MDQNFFLLGGHSMLGAQLIVRLEDLFGVEISLRYLFDHPTLAEIAAEVERQMAAGQRRRRGDRVSERPGARGRGRRRSASITSSTRRCWPNPYPLYRRLRDEDPVHWDPYLHAWVVTRYADVVTVLHRFRAGPHARRPSGWPSSAWAS